jgi:acylphosphatase
VSKPNVDFRRLTQKETAELALEALAELMLDNRVQAVLKAFDSDERDELAAWLNDDKAEKEA